MGFAHLVSRADNEWNNIWTKTSLGIHCYFEGAFAQAARIASWRKPSNFSLETHDYFLQDAHYSSLSKAALTSLCPFCETKRHSAKLLVRSFLEISLDQSAERTFVKTGFIWKLCLKNRYFTHKHQTCFSLRLN